MRKLRLRVCLTCPMSFGMWTAELRLEHRGFDSQSSAPPNCLRPGASEESESTGGGEWVVRTTSRGACPEEGVQVEVASGRQGWARANLLLGGALWDSLCSVNTTMLLGRAWLRWKRNQFCFSFQQKSAHLSLQSCGREKGGKTYSQWEELISDNDENISPHPYPQRDSFISQFLIYLFGTGNIHGLITGYIYLPGGRSIQETRWSVWTLLDENWISNQEWVPSKVAYVKLIQPALFFNGVLHGLLVRY